MLKTCLRLLLAGIVLFILGIIGYAALALNGYDADLSLPVRGSNTTDYGDAAVTVRNFAGYNSDEINKLDIDVSTGCFSVIGGDGDSFCIDAYGINSEWLKYEVKDKCLSVKYSPGFYLFYWDWDVFDFDGDDAGIIITVPRKVLESADFSVSSGYLNVECLEAERIALDITDGEAVFENAASTESSQIKMSAGECTFYDSLFNNANIVMSAGECMFYESVFSNANIKMSAGSMTYSACGIIGDSRVKMSAGSLYMELIGRRSDYDITVDKTAGHVYVDGIDFGAGAGEYAYTTMMTVTGIIDEVTFEAPPLLDSVEAAVGVEYSEDTIVEENAVEKNKIDIKLTGGECNISFNEN